VSDGWLSRCGCLDPYIVFLVLLVGGVASGGLGRKGAGTAVLTCIAAYVGVSYIPHGQTVFVSVVAVIDIVLVLAIFKGDVRL
jgi:hypothetical protein